LSEPAIGESQERHGELYNQEFFKGQAILVRFVISDITPTSLVVNSLGALVPREALPVFEGFWDILKLQKFP
jgi:hypothetical protein